jgi:hypothetical protein
MLALRRLAWAGAGKGARAGVSGHCCRPVAVVLQLGFPKRTTMRLGIFARCYPLMPLLLAVATLVGCEPLYVPTIRPDDVSFEVDCTTSCGVEGRERGVTISVLSQLVGRQYFVCCPHVAEFSAHLQTIADFWCDELDVPEKQFGDLMVGTTTSELTGERGATLDQGEGYVAFNCGEWLDGLLAKVRTAPCCQPPPGAAP